MPQVLFPTIFWQFSRQFYKYEGYKTETLKYLQNASSNLFETAGYVYFTLN